MQVLERGYKVSTIDIVVKHFSEGKPPKEFDELRKSFFEKWNKKVNGAWPISRLRTDMNKMVKSFTDDPSFVLLKDEGNYYIFKDNKTLIEVKLSVINDDKVTIEFKDHFE